MGQYHELVCMDRNEYLMPHRIGSGLKAWEQTGGGTPAALAFLIAAHPGNMPADVGHHPMAGVWAGSRLLAIGDYAKTADIPRFQGPPLDRLYYLCDEAPKLEDFQDRYYWSDRKNGSSQYEGYLFPHGYALRSASLKRYCDTAKQQFRQAVATSNKTTARGKYAYLSDVSGQIGGALEFALSTRLCGRENGYPHMIDVKPYAERGPDGHLHYRITDAIARDQEEWDLVLRYTGLGGWRESPRLDPTAMLQPSGERWPWDRPPTDLSWHNASDAAQDIGQARVYANLDRREYFDPQAFGEVPTTLGIMRAAHWTKARHCLDMVVAGGTVDADVHVGSSNDFSSAAALWAMLLCPTSRGGGDIEPEEFPLIGCWRNNRLVLTAERTSPEEGGLPSTEEVKATFDDISADVLASATQAAKAYA